MFARGPPAGNQFPITSAKANGPSREGPTGKFTWSWEYRDAWPFDPCQIADQLRIGARQLVAFLLPSAYLFRTVFQWLFVCQTASADHPLHVTAGENQF